MAFDSTIRIRQMNQAELSGFITPIVQAYLAGTGALSGVFYPRYSNPSGYLVSGAFISQTDLDSAITQALVYVSNTYYPNSNPSGFSTSGGSGGTGSLSNAVLLTGNQTISGIKTFVQTLITPNIYLQTGFGASSIISQNKKYVDGNFIIGVSGGTSSLDSNIPADLIISGGSLAYAGTPTPAGNVIILAGSGTNTSPNGKIGFNVANPTYPIDINGQIGSSLGNLSFGSPFEANGSGNFLGGLFINGASVSNWTGASTGLFYPFLSNPLSYVTTGQTGIFYPFSSNPSGYLTSGQTGLFYPYNSNPLNYISQISTGSIPFIANGSIFIMPGYDIITDAAGSPLLDAAGNYILQKTAGNLGVNQSNPQYTIDVDGSGNFSNGLYWNGNPVVTGGPYLPNSTGVVVVSGNISTSLRIVSGVFSISTGNSIILVNTLASGNTGTFPNASGLAGVQFVVKDWKGNATGNNIIITGINNQTFDGSLSKTISLSYDVLTVVSDGQNWCII